METKRLGHFRSIIEIMRPFGFESNGVIDIKVESWKVYLEEGVAKKPDKRKLGFFITTVAAEKRLRKDLETGRCALDISYVELLFTFEDMEMEKKWDGSYEYPGRIPPDQGSEYALFFANCESHVDVSAKIHAELYNEDWSGSRDYLSADEAPLPLVFLVMAILYLLSGSIWGMVMYQYRETANKIHFLMLALVFCKCLSTACEAGMYRMKHLTGTPGGWKFAFYTFSFGRGMLLSIFLVLNGAGWSFLKPVLSRKEKMVLSLRPASALVCAASPPK